MEPSIAYEDVIDKSLLSKCFDFCKEVLQYDEDNLRLWYKASFIHKHDFVKDILDPFIRQYLPIKDAKLIGDTAFMLKFPPHDVHVDNETDKYPNTKPYKTVVIPVHIEGDTIPKFFTANQYFFSDRTTRFRRGSKQRDLGIPGLVEQMNDGIFFCYDYEKAGVQFLENSPVLSKEWYDDNIDAGDAIKYENFHGLSIEKEHNWKPGNMIMFDSNRLHFSQNLAKINCQYKIGISLNYALDVSSV